MKRLYLLCLSFGALVFAQRVQQESQGPFLEGLPPDQKAMVERLSPLYQKIYIYALSCDQKEAIVVFYRRGENPYTAIDNILKRDRKRHDSTLKKQPPVRGTTQKSSLKKSYFFSLKN